MALQLRHLVQLLCLCFWDWTWSPAKPLRNALLQEVSTHAQEEDECSYKARWFEQAVKIPSSINTIYVLTIVSYSLQHFSSSEGSFHRFWTTATIKTPMFAVFALCSELETHQLLRHKIQFRQFSDFSTNRSFCMAKKKGHFQRRISRRCFNEIL